MTVTSLASACSMDLSKLFLARQVDLQTPDRYTFRECRLYHSNCPGPSVFFFFLKKPNWDPMEVQGEAHKIGSVTGPINGLIGAQMTLTTRPYMKPGMRPYNGLLRARQTGSVRGLTERPTKMPCWAH